MVAHLMLVNLTPETERQARRAAQHVWGPAMIVDSVHDIQAALLRLREQPLLDPSSYPAVVLLATGSYGDWDPVAVEELRNALSASEVPLVGLADTSMALERLHARRAPLDAALLSPVQSMALRELAESMKADGRLQEAGECRHAVAETKRLACECGWMVCCAQCGKLVVCHRDGLPDQRTINVTI